MATISLNDALGALVLTPTKQLTAGSLLPLILSNGTLVGVDLANVFGVNARGMDPNTPLDFNAIQGTGFYSASTTANMVNYPPGLNANEVFMVLQIQDTVGGAFPRAVQFGFSQRTQGMYFRCAGGNNNTIAWSNWYKLTASVVTPSV